MKKTIIWIVVLIIIILAGGYLYVSRPVKQASAPTISSGVTPVAGNGDEIRFKISPGDAIASFSVNEVLRGSNFTAIGKTSEVAGEILLNPNIPDDLQIGVIRVNARTLKTDSPQRDGAIARLILKSESAANEFIEFKPTKLSGLPAKITAGSPFSFTVVGDLTISGITKQAVFMASNVVFSGDRLKGMAQGVVNRSSFGLTIPNVPFVASVEEGVLLKIEFDAPKK